MYHSIDCLPINEYEDLTCRMKEFQDEESKILELINDYDNEDIGDDDEYNSGDGDGHMNKLYLKACLLNQRRSIVQIKSGQTMSNLPIQVPTTIYSVSPFIVETIESENKWSVSADGVKAITGEPLYIWPKVNYR